MTWRIYSWTTRTRLDLSVPIECHIAYDNQLGNTLSISLTEVDSISIEECSCNRIMQQFLSFMLPTRIRPLCEIKLARPGNCANFCCAYLQHTHQALMLCHCLHRSPERRIAKFRIESIRQSLITLGFINRLNGINDQIEDAWFCWCHVSSLSLTHAVRTESTHTNAHGHTHTHTHAYSKCDSNGWATVCVLHT